MFSLVLCFAAFLTTLICGNISYIKGIGALLFVGYFYGIIRANVPQFYSHFIFDSALLGIYLTLLGRPCRANGIKQVEGWMRILMGWPAIMILFPLQDYQIQIVGWRGNAFFIPMILIGAKLNDNPDYVRRLAFILAALNIIAFSFTILEFIFGMERFYPRNDVTELLYKCRLDVEGVIYRLPSIFPNSASYGTAMVTSLPFIVGAWVKRSGAFFEKWFFLGALLATTLGVFFSASRSQTVLLFLIIIVISFSGKLGLVARIGWILIIIFVGRVVSSEERLQRFTSLKNIDFVGERVEGSVNATFFDLVFKYPMGNGLGGGGTSIPYFLQPKLRRPVYMENEYGRIALEQGLPGLFLWVFFIIWVIKQRKNHQQYYWHFAKYISKWTYCAYLANGMIGLGMLTAIPSACLVLLMIGWTVTTPHNNMLNSYKKGVLRA